MLNREELLRLKAVTRLAVIDSGGQEAAAEATGLSRHQSFSDYGNNDMPERFIRIDLAAALDRFCGRPRFAEALAEMSGHMLVPDPRAHGGGGLLNLAGRSAEEIGALVCAVITASSDGRIDAAERIGLLAQIHELMVHLAAMAEQVRAARDEEKRT